MERYSKPYDYRGKLFVFDSEKEVVHNVFKHDGSDFERKYFTVINTAGTDYIILISGRMENATWKNKEARDELLWEYYAEIIEEDNALVAQAAEEFGIAR